MVNNADYVIVGGGSAGCVLANRLSEDAEVTVVLIETGPPAKGLYTHMPAGSIKLMGNRQTNWMYTTEPDASVGGRRLIWHSGRLLGGGSALNGTVYIRGSRHDYDQWSDMGCKGWSWDEVFPYFLRSECFEGPASQSHGMLGPLSVAPSRNPHPLVGAFVDACAASGMPRLEDYCAGDVDGAFENFVTQRRGRRSSTAHSFLRGAADRPNLTVISHTTVDRVAFDGRRATGVVIQQDGIERTIVARREVLLSAGTMQSPAILLRSGIGPAAALRAMDIPVIVDSPGVGENLHEHASFATSRFVNVPTFNTMAANWRLPFHFLNYALLGRGLLTTAPVLAMANFRSDPARTQPDLKLSFSPNCLDPVSFKANARAGMTIYVNVSPPKSRGAIRLRDRNPNTSPLIDYQHLGDPEDMRRMLIGVKAVDRIFAMPSLAQFITGMNVPAMQPDSDEAWVELIKARVGIGFHPVGTCRMGADPHAVLDAALRVHGVNGLRVVDASVMPIMPSANTNAPVIMIAEKASDLIRVRRP